MSGAGGAETWRVVRQALALLQQLQRGPADRAMLMDAVQRVVPDAYRQETKKGRDSSFDRDLWNLRHRLEVDIEWDAQDRAYHLRNPGPFFDLWLSGDELEALAFLIDTFDVEEGEAGEIVQPLLERIRSRLPDDQLRRMERQSSTLRIDLSRLDEGEIAPIVWEQVRYAVKNRRALRFHINQPQSAILGIGLIQKRAVVIEQAIAIRPTVYLSLTSDHCVLDGASADVFLLEVLSNLEQPN